MKELTDLRIVRHPVYIDGAGRFHVIDDGVMLMTVTRDAVLEFIRASGDGVDSIPLRPARRDTAEHFIEERFQQRFPLDRPLIVKRTIYYSRM